MCQANLFEIEIPVDDMGDIQSVQSALNDCAELRDFLICNSLDPDPSSRQVADRESFEYICIELNNDGASFSVSYQFDTYYDYTCDDMRKEGYECSYFVAQIIENSLSISISKMPEREDEI